MKRKETHYLLQKKNTDGAEITKQKELLTKQGYLVVTIIEGTQEMQKGLQEVVRNHFY